jgi:hypothetical protein
MPFPARRNLCGLRLASLPPGDNMTAKDSCCDSTRVVNVVEGIRIEEHQISEFAPLDCANGIKPTQKLRRITSCCL